MPPASLTVNLSHGLSTYHQDINQACGAKSHVVIFFDDLFYGRVKLESTLFPLKPEIERIVYLSHACRPLHVLLREKRC